MYCQLDLQKDTPIYIKYSLALTYATQVEKQNFILIQMYIPFVNNENKTHLIALIGQLY